MDERGNYVCRPGERLRTGEAGVEISGRKPGGLLFVGDFRRPSAAQRQHPHLCGREGHVLRGHSGRRDGMAVREPGGPQRDPGPRRVAGQGSSRAWLERRVQDPSLRDRLSRPGRKDLKPIGPIEQPADMCGKTGFHDQAPEGAPVGKEDCAAAPRSPARAEHAAVTTTGRLLRTTTGARPATTQPPPPRDNADRATARDRPTAKGQSYAISPLSPLHCCWPCWYSSPWCRPNRRAGPDAAGCPPIAHDKTGPAETRWNRPCRTGHN